ncbi:MAG: hypothetical protein M3384_10465 [Acidobacteriota bacterium]|nr:hypothetical protein [Acidobacteriota bacterium]
MDLREKIVETYKAGGITQRELAARFRVSLFFVVKLPRLERNGESLEACRREANLKPVSTTEMCRFIESELRRQNDLTLSELSDFVNQQYQLRVSTPPTTPHKIRKVQAALAALGAEIGIQHDA